MTLFPDIGRGDIGNLYWLEELQKLLAFTSSEIWFILWQELDRLLREMAKDEHVLPGKR